MLPAAPEIYRLPNANANSCGEVCHLANFYYSRRTHVLLYTNYRNLQFDKIVEAEILEANFTKRDDFNPLDGQYKEWVYHI